MTLPVLLTAALAGGCLGDEGRSSGTAVVVYAGAPRTANPLVAVDGYSMEAARSLLFLSLLEHGPDLELGLRLAESWRLEGDTAAVFSLRRGVLWSDGTETTADDVVFTVERALDPATGYPNRAQLEHVRSITAPDAYTVRVTFEPVRQAIDPVALLPVVPRHVLGAVPPADLAHDAFNLRPVTNGPFTVARARPGDRWEFGANDLFHSDLGGRPRLDRLVWRGVPESAAQLAELRTGRADMVVGVRPDAFASLGTRAGVRAVERPTLSYAGVAWNGRRAPLDDPAVRRALTMAMDRAGMLASLRGGRGVLATGPVPASHWAYATELEPLPHDPAAARAALARAGADRLRDLVLLFPAESDFSRDLAQAIQADLSRVGVRLGLQALEFGTLVDVITGPERDFDAVLLTLDADARLDLRSLFHSALLDGPFQVAGYRNPALDAVLDSIEVTLDPATSRALWGRAQATIARDQPWTWLYHVTDLILVRDRLLNVEADLAGVLRTAGRWSLDGAPANGTAAPAPARPAAP